MADGSTWTESDGSDRPGREQEPIDTFVRGTERTDRVNRPSTLAFHQFCAISPTETFYQEERSDGDILLMPWSVRPVLRYWPLTMVLMTGLYLSIPLVESGVDPVWVYLPPITPENALWMLGAVVLWGLLFTMFAKADLITDYGELFKPAIVYGLFGLLLAGVVFSLFLVWQSDSPAQLPANVVFGSGFLFAAYISGLIAYDLLIRTENMMDNFGEKNIIQNKAGYNDVLFEDLKEKMSLNVAGVPLAYVFGVLFTLQLVAFWHIQDGPHQLNSTIALVCNAFFDGILMTAVFQFLILIKELNTLLEDRWEKDGQQVKLTFQPFHPDGRGGFRDLGRAAMQVNVLVIIAGLYYAYRLFVQGLRALPVGGFSAMDGTNAVVWLVDFAGPIVLYSVVSVVWLYYTFWTTHLKMARDKEKMILDRQSSKRMETGAELDEPIGGLSDREAYEELLSSPVWPLDSRQLQTVVLSNIIPVFLTLSSLPI
jgi:hypothetical protein